jgi:hypothetical protein
MTDDFDIDVLPSGSTPWLGDAESTQPIDLYPYRLVARDSVDRVLQEFLRDGSTFVGRGLPFISRIYHDNEYDCPHIVLRLRFPIKEPTLATITGVRTEMEVLSREVASLYDSKVALSIVLD